MRSPWGSLVPILLIIPLPLFGLGCGILGGGAVREYESRIAELDQMIVSIRDQLSENPGLKEEEALQDELFSLLAKREALSKKREIAEKATETAGSGIEGILGILGVTLGIPLLGGAGKLAKLAITGRS